MLQGWGSSEEGPKLGPMETVLVFAKDSVFVASFIQSFHEHTDDTCNDT